MVVISPVVNNTADTEELFENFEAADAAHPLRYYEPVGHLITGLVAFTAYPVSLWTKPMEKHPSPSTKPITQPSLTSLSC